MEYNKNESKIIKQLLRQFDVDFVIPRGYDDLPRSVPGGDIDIYINNKDYKKGIEIAKNNLFSPKRTGQLCPISKAFKNPSRSLNVLLTKPSRAFKVISGTDKINISPSGYSEWIGYRGNIMLHLMNHLAYMSPMDGTMIRVHPDVEKSFFLNHICVRDIPVPAVPDELVHLICRGLFAHKGIFPDYYVERCKKLYHIVILSPENTSNFRRLLSLLFYKADKIVLEHVKESNYLELRNNLLRFSDY